jgi:hypothetical protein
MLKQVVAILLIVTVFVQASYKTLTVASFLLNQTYIELNECENRMVKNSTCHGKCVLAKKLETQKNDHHRALANAFETQLETYYIEYTTDLQKLHKSFFIFPKATLNATVRRFKSCEDLSSIFHPPTATV